MPAIWLIGAGLAAYENSMSGVFVFDDLPNIVNNRSLRSLAQTWNATAADIPGGLQRRVVGRWTFALNYAAGGLDVWGYHVVNIVIHVAAALLLMGIVRRTLMLPAASPALRERASPLAFCIALLWLVHPLQTESVTYIVQRLESLMGMFFLGSIYALARSASGRGMFWPVAAVVAGWLSLGCKEVGLMLPPVALLYDRLFLSTSWRELFRRRGVVHTALMAAALVYVFAGVGEVPYYTGRTGAGIAQRPSSWEYLRSQPGVLLHYLAVSFWPRDLCLDLAWPIADDGWEIYGKGALIVAALATGLVLLRYRPAAGFLILVYFVILAPSSTIVPLYVAFEHRMYLSLACLVTGVVLSMFLASEPFFRRLRFTDPSDAAANAVTLLALAAAVALAAATRRHNETYHSSIALWDNVVQIAPHNARGHMNLASHLSTAGKHSAADKHYRQAIRLQPSSALAHYNFGVFLDNDLQKPQRAIAHLEEAIRLEPRRKRYHFALGTALEDLGEVSAAETCYRRAIEIDPNYESAQHNLDRLLRLQRDADSTGNP